MDATGTDLLFVYGSLRRGSAHPMAMLLASNADYLGGASINGIAYLIDWYPGLVPCRDPLRRVGGDLYRMHAPDRLFPMLDEYEECTPGHPAPHEYRRTVAPVLHGARTVHAWTYFYNRPVEGLDILQED